MPANTSKLAIIYDFDGTLAPGNMQEHNFLPVIGMTPSTFWNEAKCLAQEHQADEILTYMLLMLRKASAAGVSVRKSDFAEHGQTITLFEGVDAWFDRINCYGRTKGIRIEHYLVSSGNEEIIAGSPIASRFEKIYASKYIFDENGVASWPALAINYTTKTQYLFRINKGTHDLSDNEAINKVVAKHDRPVPFENMIFIGDGTTDVPCFRLVKDQGGLSIAVYKPHGRGARTTAEGYFKDGRVHCFTRAIYTGGSDLDRIVKRRIDEVAARAALAKLLA